MRLLKLQFPKKISLYYLVACLVSFGFSCRSELVLPEKFCGKELWTNKTTLLFFGYAGCQTVCPRILQKAQQIQDLYQIQKPKPDNPLQFLMVSVSEKTQNLDLVQETFSIQFQNLKFLQCKAGETKQIADLLKAPYYKNLGFLNGKEPYEHSELIFLITDKGRVQARFHFSQKPEEILKVAMQNKD